VLHVLILRALRRQRAAMDALQGLSAARTPAEALAAIALATRYLESPALVDKRAVAGLSKPAATARGPDAAGTEQAWRSTGPLAAAAPSSYIASSSSAHTTSPKERGDGSPPPHGATSRTLAPEVIADIDFVLRDDEPVLPVAHHSAQGQRTRPAAGASSSQPGPGHHFYPVKSATATDDDVMVNTREPLGNSDAVLAARQLLQQWSSAPVSDGAATR
jgi:hypothetical protein